MTIATTTIEPNFDRKIEIVTASLPRGYSNLLKKIPREDALTVMNYMISLNAEVNPSINYRKDIIKCLAKFIVFCRSSTYSKEQTGLKQFDRKDVLAFLDHFRKSETVDPLHKWIGTYNLYSVHLTRFFKWLYYPDVEPLFIYGRTTNNKPDLLN